MMASTSSDWESVLSKATARGSNVVPGVVVSAITSDGKELHSQVSGYNGLSPDAPPLTKDATFWIASCTKLATSIAALQCVERGLFTLDEPVEKYIPELADKDIVRLQPDGSAKLEQAKTKITLRHLLTHTSGLAYEWASLQLMAWRKGSPRRMDPSGTVKELYNTPLLFEPGSGWVYGSSLDWVGVLVERLNENTTLGEYLQKNIFDRLGVSGSSTTFRLNSAAAKEAKIKERLLPNANRSADGKLVEQSYGFSENVLEDSGGAGWYSSVSDYITILQDVIAPEPKLLKKENLEEWLFQGHIGNKEAINMLAAARTGMTPGEGGASVSPVDYSLGGMLVVGEGYVLPKGTLVWGGLPNLKWFAHRELGLAAMFATQVTPPGDPQAQALSARYFQEIFQMYKTSKQ